MKTPVTLLILILLSLSLSAQRNDLVGSYSFEYGEAKDATNIGGDGIIYGQPRIVNGFIGEALYFDGEDHFIVFPGRINNYLRSTRDFSISFFYRSDDLSKRNRSIMGKRHRCKGINMFDIRAGRNLGVEVYEEEYPRINCNVATPIFDREWHHYVFVKKNNISRLYKNGQLVDENRSRYVIGISDLVDFGINVSSCKRIDGTRNMKGAIDELQIYKDDLSSREIFKLYNKLIDIHREQNDYSERAIPPQTKKDNNKVDPRMDQIFGDYKDSSDQLSLNKNYFSLTINEPAEYPKYNKAVVTGAYKIEAGKLLFDPKEIILYKKGNGQGERIKYEGRSITGEIYGDIIIDLYALETPFKFRKIALRFNSRKAKKKAIRKI